MGKPEDKTQLKQIEKALKLLDKDNIGEAYSIFNEMVSSEIESSNVQWRLGELAYRLGNNLLAIHYLSKAKESLPENAEVLYLLSYSYFNIGKYPESDETIRKAIELNPEESDYYRLLSKFDYGESKRIEYLEKAIELKPGNIGAYFDIIRLLSDQRRQEEGLSYAKKLVHIEPSSSHYTLMSRVLVEQGKMEEAITVLEKAIALDESYSTPYFELSAIKKFTSDDPIIKKAENVLKKYNQGEISNQSLLYFALGKMHDDTKQWDIAFEYYRRGNVLRKPAFEPDELYKVFKERKKIYGKKLLQRAEQLGSDSTVPVFVLGLPRSGTTLIEKIIASHPDAGGAGELEDMFIVARNIDNKLKKSGAGTKNFLTKEYIDEQAEFYLGGLRKKSGADDAVRIVDKMPNNYFNLGLIHVLFPKARIIHAIRSPLDTSLSCYFQPFDVLTESCDLTWLGRRYRFYRSAMEYWKKLLPEGKIIEVHYEELIGDPVNQTRRLIESCGLPWDEKCLDYHQASHNVVTASMWQARQPIYTTSKKRWVNYASHLGDLVREISDYLDQDDIDELKKHGIKVRKKLGLGFLSASK